MSTEFHLTRIALDAARAALEGKREPEPTMKEYERSIKGMDVNTSHAPNTRPEPMREPEHGELLSGCCDGRAYMDIDPEWSSDSETWVGMCAKCKEHADFYDSEKEEETAREFTPAQQAIIDRLKEPEEETYTEAELPAMARGMGFTTPEAWEAFRDAQR